MGRTVLRGARHPGDIAFADGRIDKYEDYTIRKISDLIYVKHEDFMKAKHR